MKLSKKTIIGATTILSTIMMLSPVLASAHSMYGRNFINNSRSNGCNRIMRRENNLFSDYDQYNRGLNMRLQNLINRQNQNNCPPTSNLVDTLSNNGNFNTLTAAINAAGLTNTLNSGTFTIFAPTDQAFDNLPAGTVDALLKDIPKLQSILTYHVVSGAVPAATAETLTSAPTVNGKSVQISMKDGDLYINDSKVLLYDIRTTNGIIHVIDSVLLP